MTSPELLVTGASGRVGGSIVRRLVEGGVQVRAGYRTPPELGADPAIESIRFDLVDPRTHGPTLAGIRRLFLLWPPGTDARSAIPPFLRAAVAAGVEQVVFLSVLGADRLRVVPHAAIERMLADAPLRAAILRPAYFFQNLSTTHRDDIRLRDEIFVPAGRGRTAMVDVDDVASVAADLLLDGRGDVALELTSADAPTFDEVALALSAALDRPIRYTRPGALRFLREAQGRGYPRGLALFMVAEYSLTRLGLAGRVTGDLARVLGRAPVDLAGFVARSRAAWRARSPR